MAGEVYHVECVSWKGEILFAAPHQYGHPPMQTMHKGGVFTTRSLHPSSDDAKGLVAIHAATLKALGMYSGVTHTEFIKSNADGQFYFLETAARVGGAYIAELVEYSKGINPWVEWARLEVATLLKMEYCLPNSLREEYAGSVICLAKQEEPDLSGYTDAEVVLRLKKHHHAGLIVRSGSVERGGGAGELLRHPVSGRVLRVGACARQAVCLVYRRSFGGEDGESAGARTQDQRLKRAMLYQLSYALRPLF